MQKIIDVNQLASVLGRSASTIKKDLKRNPAAVPPRLIIPGTRLLGWLSSEVDQWLLALPVAKPKNSSAACRDENNLYPMDGNAIFGKVGE